ncbi:MAG: NAD(P)/FAD-dependent oxidoreductase [Eubacterium sp.]|nr:NAD(P)/FAD-dependent oxidoreductase [Eubacterium sp.]
MKKILIVGGGASGMMAAIQAASSGAAVHLFEQNEKLGKKLFITGKGRCNFTNDCDRDVLFDSVVTNSRFLFSAFSRFDNHSAIRFFENSGLKIKTERGGRVFPASDHSSDVIKTLENEMKRAGVVIHLGSRVTGLIFSQPSDGEKRAVVGIRLENGSEISGDAVIVSCGGLTYPLTGGCDSGLRLAEQAGHTIVPTRPALVPLAVKESYIPRLQGLSLKNVILTIPYGKKKQYKKFGEMLFTHYGISGPLVLTASSYIAKELESHELPASIDLKPALTDEQLDKRLVREFTENGQKEFKNAIGSLFPAKLRPVMVELSGIDPCKPAHDITREERSAFLSLIRRFPMTIAGTREYNEAIVTQGGIKVKEVDPKTMESKKVRGLYFTGEELDLDAVTGGFNLTIAWATGYVAGRCAAGVSE